MIFGAKEEGETDNNQIKAIVMKRHIPLIIILKIELGNTN